MKFALLALLLAASACPAPVRPVAEAAIDCLGSNRGAIDNILGEFRPVIESGSVDWSAVRQRGKQAGMEIGTCFIMELTQAYLSGTRAPADAKMAYDLAQEFKASAGGAVVITRCKRDDGTSEVCRL